MSYLSPLRLHFAGQFQAAPSTVNNTPKNYNNATFQPSSQTPPPVLWNPVGNAHWRLIGCHVKSAFDADGKPVSSKDQILSYLIADSDRRAPAKLVDLDPDQPLVSAIWGLEVRICTTQGETLLRGEFETASFIDLWKRATSSGGNTGDFALGAMYQSVLFQLEWGDISGSPFLTELRDTTQDGLLSIKFNVDGYTMSSSSPNFTMGRIVGTIGPAMANEPRHFVKGRQFVTGHPQNQINVCTAVVDQGKILLDLGNALPTTQPGGPLANQGELSLVCQAPGQPALPLGSIPYSENGWYEKTAGIVELPADRNLTDEEIATIATQPLALLLPDSNSQPQPARQEAPDGAFVRADQFVFRLNPAESVQVQFLATRFGQSYAKAHIHLLDINALLPGAPANPSESALEYPSEIVAEEDGTATATIQGHDPKNPRGFIDGQVYILLPTLKDVASKGVGSLVGPFNIISLLLFDEFHPDEPPTWWGSLQPIFQQYANLYPVMSRFFNLADYDSLCENRELLLFALNLDERNPGHMPVTRDLSASKRKAILRWLTEVGADGKPLLGTPPAAHIAPAMMLGRISFPSAASPDELRGSKTAALNRLMRLLAR